MYGTIYGRGKMENSKAVWLRGVAGKHWLASRQECLANKEADMRQEVILRHKGKANSNSLGIKMNNNHTKKLSTQKD